MTPGLKKVHVYCRLFQIKNHPDLSAQYPLLSALINTNRGDSRGPRRNKRNPEENNKKKLTQRIRKSDAIQTQCGALHSPLPTCRGRRPPINSTGAPPPLILSWYSYTTRFSMPGSRRRCLDSSCEAACSRTELHICCPQWYYVHPLGQGQRRMYSKRGGFFGSWTLANLCWRMKRWNGRAVLLQDWCRPKQPPARVCLYSGLQEELCAFRQAPDEQRVWNVAGKIFHEGNMRHQNTNNKSPVAKT